MAQIKGTGTEPGAICVGSETEEVQSLPSGHPVYKSIHPKSMLCSAEDRAKKDSYFLWIFKLVFLVDHIEKSNS
jgi:hypothetical protein